MVCLTKLIPAYKIGLLETYRVLKSPVLLAPLLAYQNQKKHFLENLCEYRSIRKLLKLVIDRECLNLCF